MITTITSGGRVLLPAALRRLDNIKPGEQFEVERLARGEYRLVRSELLHQKGLVDWLLACPEKGFFTHIESETTETL